MSKGRVYNLLLFMFIPLSFLGQKPGGYEIIGRVAGLHEGEKVIMSLVVGDHISSQIDSGYVKNGEFHISGKVPEGPRMYFLDFNQHIGKTCRILIDNGEKITVSCDSSIEKISHSYFDNFFQINGSPSNTTWHAFTSGTQVYFQNIGMLNRYLQKIKDSIGFERSLVETCINIKNSLNDSYYWNAFDGWDDAFSRKSIPFILMGNKMFITSGHAPFIKSVYNKLDGGTRSTHYGKLLERVAKLSVGETFPDFTLPSSEGTPLNLKGVCKKGKVTLVHFWATNSYQREEYQNELQVYYKKYHDKGLNIVGVSADSVEYIWKGFLKEHKQELPWYQVSDLKGNLDGGIINDVYFEGGHRIPNTTNVLLDEQGKIIAWDPLSIELRYYLEKYLEIKK